MSDTLQLLLEQAERERDTALGRLRQAEQALQLAQAQAAQLADYREDYRRRAPALNGRGANIELVRCHHGFMQRLDQAIEQQRASLQHQQRSTAALREALLECEMRVAAMRKLQQQRATQAAQRAARQDQRLTDEAALRLALRRSAVDAHPASPDDAHDSAAGALPPQRARSANDAKLAAHAPLWRH